MKILNEITNLTKEILKKDGFLTPVFLTFKSDQLIGEPQSMLLEEDIPAEEAKDKSTFIAGVTARIRNADSIILIWDAAFRTFDSSKEYDQTEAPLTYPKSLRTECIVIYEIKLTSGKTNIKIILYKGGDKEPVEFLPEIPDEQTFESRFTDIVL